MASSDSEPMYFDGSLVNSRELIEKIFSYLGYQDLISASKVCKTWRHVVRQIKKRRILRYFTVHSNFLLTSEMKITTNQPTQMESIENGLSSLKTKNPETYYCLGFAAGDLLRNGKLVTKYSKNGASLYQIIRSVIAKNSEMILMEGTGTVGTNELPENFQNVPKTEDDEMETDLAKMNSESVNTVQNITKTNDDEMETYLVEMDSESEEEIERDMKEFCTSANRAGYTVEIEQNTPLIYQQGLNYPPGPFDSFSLLLIPKQFGVKIKIFELNENNFLDRFRANSSPEEKDLKSHPVTQDEFNSLANLTAEDQLKSLLLFSCKSDPLWRSAIMAAIEREKNELALGGGMVNFLQRDNLLFQSTYGVAISGKNVQASSIVIPRTVSCGDELHKTLRKLKLRNLPEENSFAFMFSNCVRGCSWYKKRFMNRDDQFVSVESNTFRRLFPNTPLFGFFGDGEIGNEFYTPKHENRFGIPSKVTKFLHQFSAVFILISIT